MIVDLAGAEWFKSTYSGGDKECVEAAFLPNDLVAVRDSKNPSGAALVFTSDEWSGFTTALDNGRFDR
ncbi:DUF397 domain-containing protein [Nocardia mexicana]|uniref:Uncharacterized protein DUF397 n=1 Tax=Nocardia mexicana TaxID=279262 RepID=A0A370H5E1_9NOCA|nr:DUF397 domain-containing protein [Nocardia mexicana]RDI51602.1 uncharacterized protein DUF397 [Nocardia mexicana]